MITDDDDKLICLGCGYETSRVDFLQSRKKGEFPHCPKCQKELSFKEPALLAESRNPLVPILILAVIFFLGFLGISGIRGHFATKDGRKVVRARAGLGQMFYGGETRARVPALWEKTPYDYEKYWKHDLKDRMAIMINEEHAYFYDGIQGSEVRVKYRYTDSTGKEGYRYLKAPLVFNRAQFEVPAIPYIKDSQAHLLEITQSGNNEIGVWEVQLKSGVRDRR